ncbi:uncharacterized protein LOC113766861 [Coffea eugenioides]|uniref:uncharacterized protein LOC113766861 n=1 Tax=Coffea eugenioides TaxID=49369 RepID=UPI000F606332|nr:uncharacterized protein LOC113766861 [Coffea eugenioides]
MPKYCVHCFCQGHDQSECHVKNPELRPNLVHGERRLRVGVVTMLSGDGNKVGVGHDGGEAVTACGATSGDAGPVGAVLETMGQQVAEQQDVEVSGKEAAEAGGTDQLLVVGEETGYGQDSMGAAVSLVEQALDAAAGRIIIDLAERVVTEQVPVVGERDILGSGEQVGMGKEEDEEVLAGESSDDVICAGCLSPRGAGVQRSEGEEANNVAMTLHLDQVAVLE